jgi:hypothetical protein
MVARESAWAYFAPHSAWRVCRFLVTCCLLAASGLAGTSRLCAQSVPSIDEVFAVWRARQDRVKTLEIRWTERSTYFPGAFSNAKDPGERYPKEDTIFERQGALYLDGTNWRYDLNGPEWWETAGAEVQTRRTEIVTEHTYTRYMNVDEREDDVYPFAKISPLDAYHGVPPVWPIFNLYRPLVQPMGDFAPAEWSFVAEQFVNEFRTALLARRGYPQAPQKAWIDLDNPELPPVRPRLPRDRPGSTRTPKKSHFSQAAPLRRSWL